MRGRGKHTGIQAGALRQVKNTHLSKTIRTKSAFVKKFNANDRARIALGKIPMDDKAWVDYLVKDQSNAVRLIVAKERALTKEQFQALFDDWKKGAKLAQSIDYSLVQNNNTPGDILFEIGLSWLKKESLPKQTIGRFGMSERYNNLWGDFIMHPNFPTQTLALIHQTDNMPLQSFALENRQDLYSKELALEVSKDLTHISMNALTSFLDSGLLSDDEWKALLFAADLPVYQRQTIEFSLSQRSK